MRLQRRARGEDRCRGALQAGDRAGGAPVRVGLGARGLPAAGGLLPSPPAAGTPPGGTSTSTSSRSPAGRRGTLRLAHVTDTHVGAEGYRMTGEILRGDLRDLIGEAAPDVIVVSGDLTDWGTPPELESFREAVADVGVPVRPMFGGHDGNRERFGDLSAERLAELKRNRQPEGDPADREAEGGRRLHEELRGGPRTLLVQLRPGRPALRPLSQRGELLLPPGPGAEAGLAAGRPGRAAGRPGGGRLRPHPPGGGPAGSPGRFRRAAGPARALAFEPALRKRRDHDRRDAPHRHRGHRHPRPGLPSPRLRGRGAADLSQAAGPGRLLPLAAGSADHAGGGERTPSGTLDAIDCRRGCTGRRRWPRTAGSW